MENFNSQAKKSTSFKLVFLFLFLYGLAHLSPNGFLQNISVFSAVGPQAAIAQEEEEEAEEEGEEESEESSEGEEESSLGIGDVRTALEIGLVVLIVLLIVLGLIVGFNKLKGSEEPEEVSGQTYY